MTARHRIRAFLPWLAAEPPRPCPGECEHEAELERAEAAIARVRDLADRIQQGVPWTANADDTAAHIRAALDEPAAEDLTGYTAPDPAIGCITGTAEPAPAWTPPPPGSTREQLPAEILDLLDGYLSPYRSTACDTAGSCERAYRNNTRWMGLLQRAEMLHQRCRLNHKFTGALCICPCHTKEPTS